MKCFYALLIVSVSLFFILAPACQSMDMASCHCFRDRSYDPADRFAADDYLLATSFNALIARVFGISKGEIIMKKMRGGVNGNDLLIALFLSTTCGRPYPLLLSIKADGGSWQQIAASACGESKDRNPVLAALAKGEDSDTIARLITSYMLKKRYPDADKAIEALQHQLTDPHKIALILALARQTSTPPEKILRLYRDEKKSFSQIAHEHGLTPDEVGKAVLNGP